MAVRTHTNCPFVPGSDAIPEVWAGRSEELADWRDKLRARRRAGVYERGRAVLGPAGIGKSVLVRRIAREAADAGDLVADQVRIPRGADPLALAAEALVGLADRHLGAATSGRIGELLGRVRRVAHPAAGTVELAGPPPGDAFRDVHRLVVEMGRVAAAQDRAVVIRIDDIGNVDDDDRLSQLLIAVGDALAHEDTSTDAAGITHTGVLPLAVYLTGLPASMRSSRLAGATFARRFLPIHLGPLSDAEIRHALAPFRRGGFEVIGDDGPRAVFMEDGAADVIAEACQGDPYLFQLAGDAAWSAGEGEVITADEARRGWNGRLREPRSHVERILERIPDRERATLDAIAALPPDGRTATAVADTLGKDGAAAIASALQRLDEQRSIIRRGSPITFRMRAVEAYLTGGWPAL